MAAPADFIGSLYGDIPEGLYVGLWDKPTKQSLYIATAAEADQHAGSTDVYIAVCLSGTTPKNRRLKARDAKAIAGVWVDIDMPGPEDPPGKRPADGIDQATAIATHLHEPTLLVNSGYGLQAYWLFEDPWIFAADSERDRAAQIAQGWVRLHQLHAMDTGGVKLDSVGDLARVMRLPGTINGKGDTAPVELLDHEGPRYRLDELAELALTAPVPTGGVHPVEVDPRAELPVPKLEAMMENVPKFEATWLHKRRDRAAAGWSTSEYDLALASFAVNAGWTDAEITALLVAHRKLHDGENSEKARRVKYLADTIGRARNAQAREERAEVREQALEQLAQIGDSDNGHVQPEQILGAFNAAVGAGVAGAPVFKELVQYGDDPDSARYVLVTDAGVEVNVGPYANLRQPRRLDERLGPATRFVMETTKDNDVWRSAMRGLLKACTLKEEPEEPILEWVRRYVHDRLGADRNHAAEAREPFEEDDFLHVRLDELSKFVRVVLRQRITAEADLKPLLRRAGFEQASVHFTKRDGSRSTASYWRVDKRSMG